MKEINSLADLSEHISFENNDFSNRYVPFEKVAKTLSGLPEFFQVETNGKSVDGEPIYSVQFGNGKTKVLMWSQMHGNETTTTKAVLELLKTFSLAGSDSFCGKIISECTILIVPVLNPDGAIIYSRENKNRVDLNRDATNLSQPESKVLHKIFENFAPHFCFNLHDQRSIYGVGNTPKPAIISFLAPSADEQKSVGRTRETAMKLIVEMNDFLQFHIPGSVGRYDDSFNPNCVGDKFQRSGVPTILFEAGHWGQDYQRNKVRNFVYLSLFQALHSISTKSYEHQNFQKYFNIPENEKTFFDIVLRNLSINGNITDIAIQYEERFVQHQIIFVPIVEKIGNLSKFHGHRQLKFNGEKLTINHAEKIHEKTEIHHINKGKDGILIDLTNK